MKVEKYYCDICNKSMLPQITEHITIENKKYDLCNSCLKELREKTLLIFEEMKHNKIMEGGE